MNKEKYTLCPIGVVIEGKDLWRAAYEIEVPTTGGGHTNQRVELEKAFDTVEMAKEYAASVLINEEKIARDQIFEN